MKKYIIQEDGAYFKSRNYSHKQQFILYKMTFYVIITVHITKEEINDTNNNNNDNRIFIISIRGRYAS